VNISDGVLKSLPSSAVRKRASSALERAAFSWLGRRTSTLFDHLVTAEHVISELQRRGQDMAAR
jgi:hypothetical protein